MIYNRLLDKLRKELRDILLIILKRLFGSKDKIMSYIEDGISEIESTIYNGVRLKTLDKIFV